MGKEPSNDKPRRTLAKVYKYLRQQNIAMPAYLWHEMLDVIQEVEEVEKEQK